jgi:hypothetical protein
LAILLGLRRLSPSHPDLPALQIPIGSSCESRVASRGEFSDLDKPRLPSDKAEFVFNCYDAPNEARAEARIDGGPWLAMPGFAASSPVTDGLTMPHHFRLVTDTRALEPGSHAIEVRVTCAGEIFAQERASFQQANSSDPPSQRVQ